MKQEDIQAALEAIGKGGIKVAGDLVIEKHVEYEVDNVEAGGIGIQVINGEKVEDDTEKNETERSVGVGESVLKAERQTIVDRLMELADKGDWADGITASDIKKMLKNVLGLGEAPLTDDNLSMSVTLWNMLEHGRGGDRVRITWQNLVGYLDDKGLFKKKSSPKLNRDFFEDKNGYDNINKGRPNSISWETNMPQDFQDVLPLLDTFVSQVYNSKVANKC